VETYPPSEPLAGTKEGIIYRSEPGKNCLDEVQEVVVLRDDIASITACTPTEQPIPIDSSIQNDLRSYVMMISEMYHENPFHNFEHACHVTMSVNKLLQRIVSPELSDDQMQQSKNDANFLHNHLKQSTYGIYSDPIAQFAIVFSALIHDVDLPMDNSP
jgi:hypothetical protein